MNELDSYDKRFVSHQRDHAVGQRYGRVWADTVGRSTDAGQTEVAQPATTQAKSVSNLDVPGNWEEVATEAQVREEHQRENPLPGPRPEITVDGLHTSMQAAWGEDSQPERKARKKVFLGYNPAK